MILKNHWSQVKKYFLNEIFDKCKLIIIDFSAEIGKHDRIS